MSNANYKKHWNSRSESKEAAFASVDASTDEALLQHTGTWGAEQIRAALDVTPEDTVLELGCGVARIGLPLSRQCGRWIGADISENMLKHAAERLQGQANASVHALQDSSLRGIGDNTVDKAYSVAVFCHLDKEDLYLYLQELFRVVRPGGMIFVETWNLAHPVGWRRWAYEPLVWSTADQSERKDVARNQFCTPIELELYVQHAGFQVLKTFSESQSIQLLAGKDMTESQAEAQSRRADEAREQIAYSPLYAEFFGLFVDMIFGKIAPASMLQAIDDASPSPESDLFRPYVLGVWRRNANIWGDPPQ